MSGKTWIAGTAEVIVDEEVASVVVASAERAIFAHQAGRTVPVNHNAAKINFKIVIRQ